MTVIYFVRHAVIADTGKRLSGRTPGLHLSEQGIEQARAAARSLAEAPLKAIYSSPIERCLETAEIVAEPHRRLEVQIEERLVEVDYGSWSNRTYASLRRTKLWSTVQRWPSSASFPGGEGIRDVQARAVTAVDALGKKHRRSHICCVSHADVIRVVMAHYLGVHLDLYQRLVISPASVTVLGIGADGPRVLALNRTPLDDGSP